MIDDHVIAVVVPAFNEARWIESVIHSMPDWVDHLIVDDASHDDTAARVRACSRAILVQHDHNRGVGAALISGYREAQHRGADVMAVMAGDGQMDVADLRTVLQPILADQADYVKGNRLQDPQVWHTMPRHRLLGSLLLSRLTGWAAGVPIHDSQCGYTAIARHAFEAIDLDQLWQGYGYPNDLIGLLATAGMRIAEVPVRPVYRGEASGLRPRHLAVMLGLIARVGWRRWQRRTTA